MRPIFKERRRDSERAYAANGRAGSDEDQTEGTPHG